MNYLYQLVGGLSIYGEPGKGIDTKDLVTNGPTFKASEACFIIEDGGNTKIIRADKGIAKPTVIQVPWSAVVMWHDLTAPDLLKAIISEMSGLTIASVGPRIVN